MRRPLQFSLHSVYSFSWNRLQEFVLQSCWAGSRKVCLGTWFMTLFLGRFCRRRGPRPKESPSGRSEGLLVCHSFPQRGMGLKILRMLLNFDCIRRSGETSIEVTPYKEALAWEGARVAGAWNLVFEPNSFQNIRIWWMSTSSGLEWQPCQERYHW